MGHITLLTYVKQISHVPLRRRAADPGILHFSGHTIPKSQTWLYLYTYLHHVYTYFDQWNKDRQLCIREFVVSPQIVCWVFIPWSLVTWGIPTHQFYLLTSLLTQHMPLYTWLYLPASKMLLRKGDPVNAWWVNHRGDPELIKVKTPVKSRESRLSES